MDVHVYSCRQGRELLINSLVAIQAETICVSHQVQEMAEGSSGTLCDLVVINAPHLLAVGTRCRLITTPMMLLFSGLR